MFVLAVVRKALAFFALPFVAGTALLWLLTLTFSFAFCALVRMGRQGESRNCWACRRLPFLCTVRAGAQLYQNWLVLFGKGALTKIVSTNGVD